MSRVYSDENNRCRIDLSAADWSTDELHELYKTIGNELADVDWIADGLIPCVISDRKTHTYKIAKSDIIEYLRQRDIAPEEYILPEGSYARTSVMSDAEHSTVVHVDFTLFEEYPDVLSVRQAAELSRVMQKTVASWAKKNHLKAFIKNNAYHIPKIALVEYLQSPRHRRNCIWKQNNLAKQAGK